MAQANSDMAPELKIDILSKLCPAKVIVESPYDPVNARLRAENF